MSGRETRATRAAARAAISFKIHEYEHDPNAASYGGEAAGLLGVDPARIFKTLLATVDSQLVVAVVPVSGQLNLKRLAKAAGGKKATLADAGLAERTTGYVLGGISPLGQRKQLQTYIDESAAAFETVYVSAGRRGLEIELTPADLASITEGTFASLSRD